MRWKRIFSCWSRSWMMTVPEPEAPPSVHADCGWKTTLKERERQSGSGTGNENRPAQTQNRYRHWLGGIILLCCLTWGVYSLTSTRVTQWGDSAMCVSVCVWRNGEWMVHSKPNKLKEPTNWVQFSRRRIIVIIDIYKIIKFIENMINFKRRSSRCLWFQRLRK